MFCYTVISIFAHLSYCVLFAAFYRDIDELTESLFKLHEKVGKLLKQEKSEEDVAKEEIRIKTMQDKIDELVEHQRIFDILLTRYEARILELEGPPKAAEEKNTAQDDSVTPESPAQGYVEYEPYN